MLENVRRRKLALASGVEIALLDWGGDGPLALLHHANGFCGGVWGLVAEPLSRHFRVVAVDARGHGDSSKPPPGPDTYCWQAFADDVAGVAQRLAAEHADGRIALGLGHSFGGTSILMAAAQHPELFARCLLVDPVLISPQLAPRDPGRSEVGSSLIEGARNRRTVWPDRATAREKWRGKPMFAHWDPRALELYLAFGMRDLPDGGVELKCSGAVEAAVFEASHGGDPLAWAPAVRARTRILCAARGNFPRPVYESIAAAMSDADVRDIDAGHLAVMERPDLVVAEAREFAGV